MSYSSKRRFLPMFIPRLDPFRLVATVLFVLLFVSVRSPVWAQTRSLNGGNRAEFANLVYDAELGTVLLSGSDTDSGNIISFALTIAAGQQPLRLAAVQLPFENTGRNTDVLVFQVGQFADSSDTRGFEAHVLGPIFPRQMSSEQLLSYLDTAVYASELGVGGNLDALVLQDLNRGDFTGDQALNGSDVNLLCGQIASNGIATFDLTGDRKLDTDDLTQLLTVANIVPGDADFDGSVAFGDFLRLANNFGEEGTFGDGDFGCNGVVDFQDFLELANNFGRSTREEAAATLPEPESVNLLVLAFLALLRPLNKVGRTELRMMIVGCEAEQS